MKALLLFAVLLIAHLPGSSQDWYQYFDGADTSQSNSIIIDLDTSATNCWQVGMPSKNWFDSASTLPNALVTDTLNAYPINNQSSFGFQIPPDFFPSPWGIVAIQWKQKLDMESGKDGGVIEFSYDKVNWSNVFNNPYVYNFYGYNPANADTLANGNYSFSGTDTLWRDIWLCYDNSWAWTNGDTLFFRYTLQSDSTDTQQEGWMIDNMMLHLTIVHTVGEIQEEYLKVFPTQTTGIVNIQARKMSEYHIIEKMELRDANGKLVETFGLAPTRFFIDISGYPAGMYFLTVQTNIKSETVKLVLQH